jgi:hypothetical protein
MGTRSASRRSVSPRGAAGWVAVASIAAIACAACGILAPGIIASNGDAPDSGEAGTTNGPDDPGGAGIQNDPGADVPDCDLGKPFDSAEAAWSWERFTELPDEQTAILVKDDPYCRTSALWIGTRASAHDDYPFEDELFLKGNCDVKDSPTITADALTLYFLGTSGLSVMKRASAAVDFDEPRIVPELAHVAPVVAPPYHSTDSVYVAPNGSALYFSANGDILRSDVAGDAVSPPVRVDLGAANGSVSSPVISPDELTLYFARKNECGDPRVWFAQRTSIHDSFGPASPLTLGQAGCPSAPDFGSSVDPTWVSANGCRLYVRSCQTSVASSYGGANYYTACSTLVATRPPRTPIPDAGPTADASTPPSDGGSAADATGD